MQVCAIVSQMHLWGGLVSKLHRCVIWILLVLHLTGCRTQNDTKVTSSYALSDPVIVADDTGFRKSQCSDWRLQVYADGRALVETSKGVQSFKVPESDLKDVFRALSGVLKYQDSYGRDVVDGPKRTLMFAYGGKKKTIALYYLGRNYLDNTDSLRLREAVDVVNLFIRVRQLFKCAQAFDATQYDLLFINRVAERITGGDGSASGAGTGTQRVSPKNKD